MKMTFLIILIFFPASLWAQYAPRGIVLNDGYLPNLDEPDKWILGVDGMIDYQKETDLLGNTSSQRSHFNINGFYGGQKVRGGLQVMHNSNGVVRDLSVGLGFSFYRPLFLELGAGYLQRSLVNNSFDGWAYNLKIGYYVNWIMHIKYRLRIRLSVATTYKTINVPIPNGDTNALQFFPFLGLEFET